MLRPCRAAAARAAHLGAVELRLAPPGAYPVLEVGQVAGRGLPVGDGLAQQLERLGLERGVEVGVLGDHHAASSPLLAHQVVGRPAVLGDDLLEPRGPLGVGERLRGGRPDHAPFYTGRRAPSPRTRCGDGDGVPQRPRFLRETPRSSDLAPCSISRLADPPAADLPAPGRAVDPASGRTAPAAQRLAHDASQHARPPSGGNRTRTRRAGGHAPPRDDAARRGR